MIRWTNSHWIKSQQSYQLTIKGLSCWEYKTYRYIGAIQRPRNISNSDLYEGRSYKDRNFFIHTIDITINKIQILLCQTSPDIHNEVPIIGFRLLDSINYILVIVKLSFQITSNLGQIINYFLLTKLHGCPSHILQMSPFH